MKSTNSHFATRRSIWLWCAGTTAALAFAERGNAEELRKHEPPASASSGASRAELCKNDPRVRLGLVTEQVCAGAELFFRETFGGNGRTCGTCHPAQNNYTIDASSIARLAADDPLFVAETNPDLVALEQPELLRGFGLILVNADGGDDPTQRFVMRSVPHTLSLATSLDVPPLLPIGTHAFDGTAVPPLQRTGWAGDGAPGTGTLRDFSDGAIRQHATLSLERVKGRDFALPSDAEREALSAFMLSLGRQRDIALDQVQLADAGAERGRQSFLSGPARDCNGCHDNAGANAVISDEETGERSVTNFSFEVGTERARLALLDDYGIPFDGGFGVRPFDSDGDGIDDAFGNGAFNTPPLIEAADTGPFFHTHAAGSIEEAIEFYTTETFGRSLSGSAPSELRPDGGPIRLTCAEIDDLGRFLRVLNAALNCQIASARIEAALEIGSQLERNAAGIDLGLLQLAEIEIDDALADLHKPHLGTDSVAQLRAARSELQAAQAARGAPSRRRSASRALRHVQAANAQLGTGLTFDLGAGTLMF